ncbi:MAG: DUF4248 domain-containing protein [Bacteroides sp.]|nr:DUF4248 domain-containing protein [Bacteroides sp.]
MKREEHYEHLTESFQTVSEIAQAYFPNYAHARSAVRRFRKEVERDAQLGAALGETDYVPETLMLTPKQVGIIYLHWGVPGQSQCRFRKLFQEHSDL